MGIFGALQSAVSGLKAQSHAMENISGNIANSQTIGYKRIDTSFADMIPDAPVKRQIAGSVSSFSRSTNTLGGDIQSADTETYMALNNSGFFVVQPSDGSSGSFYTRRGDFDVDRDGYLVNGAGYRLMGLKMVDGVLGGGTSEAVKIDNSFLPAKQTTSIEYSLNLPQTPKTSLYDATKPGSELLRPWLYSTVAGPTPHSPSITGTVPLTTTVPPAAHDGTVVIELGDVTRTYRINITGSPTVVAGEVLIDGSGTPEDMLSAIQADLKANGGPDASGAALSVVSGNVVVSFAGNYRSDLEITGTAAAALGVVNSDPAASGTLPSVSAANVDQFTKESISGSGITVYSVTGEPIDVQLRWAKLSNGAETETWGLFYASDSRPGAAEAWTKLADYNYKNGLLDTIDAVTPKAEASGKDQLRITDLLIDGASLGPVSINHAANSMTQFAASSGAANLNAFAQNGFGAGKFVSVGVSGDGRVLAAYSNGETREVYQIVTANFSNANALRRGDGGVYSVTAESGEAMLSQSGEGIASSSIESSNTDISEEFTKLIVTQQAYSANTKIVTAADEMLQEALNMIR